MTALPWWGWLIIGIVIVFLVAGSFVPIPGYYNVRTETELSETCVLGFCSYSVQSVSPAVEGGSVLLDWAVWFNVAGISTPCVDCQYDLTVTLTGTGGTAGVFSSSASETKFISDIFTFNQQDLVTTQVAWVTAGTYNVQASLTLNGAQVAQGGGSLTVGGG